MLFMFKENGPETSGSKKDGGSKNEYTEKEAERVRKSIEAESGKEDNGEFIDNFGLGDVFEGVGDLVMSEVVEELRGYIESKSGVDLNDPKEYEFLRQNLREKAEERISELEKEYIDQEGGDEEVPESLDEKYKRRKEALRGRKEIGANDPQIEKDAQEAMEQIDAMSRKEENNSFIERFDLQDLFEDKDIGIVGKDKCVQELNDFLEKKTGVNLDDPKEFEMMREKLRMMAKGYLDNIE